MEIELNRFTPAEQATFRLRALYEQAGYRKYRASRFEEYALYQEYQRFLPDAQVITFTDLDGKLRAIKPDVTLSIAKTAQPAAGECKRFYYNEEVCRPSRESHTFQTIHQMGLESMGAVDADEQAAVVRLALQSLAALDVPTVLEISHMGYLTGLLDETTACVYVQHPNFYGQLEDCSELAGAAHGAGAKLILGVNPATLGVLRAPADYGADIAVGEGQPLGLPLAWGGPYLGFMAATAPLMRKLPGRIVGETVDAQGKRAFVLTMQAREQHIRREKASSNVCSNEALCALTASIYLSLLGPEGLRQVGEQSCAKAHYLAGALCALPGVSLRFPGPFFHEFVTELPRAPQVLAALEAKGILGGLPVEGGLLWCVTEKCSRSELDEAVAIVKEVLG